MDTTVFTFLFTACFWMAAETVAEPSLWRFTALCLTAALTSLTRQVGDLSLALVITLVIWTMIAAGKSKVGLLFPILLAAVLAMAGAFDNYLHNGVFKRTVALGVNLYTHASEYALSDPKSPEWDFVETHLPDARAQTGKWNPDYRQAISWSVNALPHRLERALGSHNQAEILAANKTLTDRSIRWARKNPRSYLASIRNEASRLLWKCEEYYPQSLLGKVIPIPTWALRLERGIIHQPLWLLFGLGGLAILIGRGKRMTLVIFFLGPASYVLLIASIQLGFTRYALPILPTLLILSGHALDRVTAWISPPTA